MNMSTDELARLMKYAAKKFENVDVLEGQLRQARQKMEAAVRIYSYAKGFKVPLRPEAVRLEIGA